MKSVFILLFFIFGTVLPKSDRMYSDSADTLQLSIDTIFEEYDRSDSPGCIVSVYKGDQQEFFSAYGMANLDYGIALSDSSSFYMASISKQVTAFAGGLLIERELLQEHEYVKSYLEDWPDFADSVTVQQLFNHTSGLPDLYDLMEIAGISLSNVMNVDDYYAVIKQGESLKHEPGAEYSYTNSGYTVITKLIEKLTETSFAEFVHEEILTPLGMNSTHFHDSRHRVIPNRAISYAPGNNGFRQTYLSNFQGVGPGGLYSTPQDWAAWAALWHGQPDLPQEFDVVREWLLQRAIVGDEPLTYANGIHVNHWKGLEVFDHSGSFMGFKNDYRIYPEFGISFLTLCNRQDAKATEKNRDVARLWIKDHIEEFLQPYAGRYQSPELDATYELTIEDSKLVLNRRLSPRGPMAEESHDHWIAGSWDFKFERDDDGEITGFLLSTSRASDVEFRKVD